MCTVEGSLYKEIGCFPEGGRKAKSLTCNFYRGNNPKTGVWLNKISPSWPAAFPPLYHKKDLFIIIYVLFYRTLSALLKPFLNYTCTRLSYETILANSYKNFDMKKKKYQARKHEFKEPKIALRLVTVHKNEFLFRKKKKINAVLLIINIYLWDKTIRYII